MGANPEPTAWMEQILATSDLSALLPAAIGWIHGTGCRASDLSKETADELAIFLAHQTRMCPPRLLDHAPGTVAPLWEGRVAHAAERITAQRHSSMTR